MAQYFIFYLNFIEIHVRITFHLLDFSNFFHKIQYFLLIFNHFASSTFFGLEPPPTSIDTTSFSVLSHGSSNPMKMTIDTAMEYTRVEQQYITYFNNEKLLQFYQISIRTKSY